MVSSDVEMISVDGLETPCLESIAMSLQCIVRCAIRDPHVHLLGQRLIWGFW